MALSVLEREKLIRECLFWERKVRDQAADLGPEVFAQEGVGLLDGRYEMRTMLADQQLAAYSREVRRAAS